MILDLLKTKNILILLTILAFSYGTTSVLAQNTDPSISYEGAITEDTRTYTFKYTVTSGTSAITKWKLKSSFFKRIDIHIRVTAQDETQGSQKFEPVFLHSPILSTLEFDHVYDHNFNGSTVRHYNITLYKDDYSGITISEIDYLISSPSGITLLNGTITGPIDPKDTIEPPPAWYNSIPPIIIPIGVILLALIAWRLKWI